MKNKIGTLIKKSRKSKGLTLQQVADICGVSNSMVSNWERGVNIPAGDVLIRLAKRLDFTEELLADDKSEEEIVLEEVEKMMTVLNDMNKKLNLLPSEYLPGNKNQSLESTEINDLKKKLSQLEKKISKFEKQLKDISDMKERMNAIEHQYNINQNRDIVLNTAGSKKT